MNAPRCTDQDYLQFLIASPGPVTCTEAARGQPHSPFAPAHDSFNRLLHRLDPEPEVLWQEAEPLVEKPKGFLIIDDSTLDKLYAKKIELGTRHWSGELKQFCGVERCQVRAGRAAQPHRDVVAGIPAAGVAFLHHRGPCVRGQVAAGAR